MSLQDAGEAHAFVDDLDAPVLSAEDLHHLERVLRLRRGAPITVADGFGRWRLVRFGVGVGAGSGAGLGGALEPIGAVEQEAVADPAVGVAFALVKRDRPELVVQKLTELGVDTIVPFTAARSVVTWAPERAGRHHERLVKIAREAAMQCRRARLPIVEPVATFGAVATRPGAVLATQGGQLLRPDHTFVLIGPEGGWSPEELAVPLPHVGLAPYVLRSETAAITAGALLVARRRRFV